MIKKYDWNPKFLDDHTTVLILKAEESSQFDDWKEVKRVTKPQPTRKAKEAEDAPRRGKRVEGGDRDFPDRSRNFRGSYCVTLSLIIE